MPETPVIQTIDLTRTYRTGKTEVRALRSVNLTIQPGEMVAIMGASGSGKSTLMNILGCLDTASSGTYLLDGVRVDNLSRNERADLRNARIGFVFQGFNLLARTSALENVELPLLYDRQHRFPNARARAREALELVGLGDRVSHDPSELSGGEQQRVAIARALITRPRLLLADEPTGNLDTKTSIEIIALFQALRDQGHTVILVTHEHDIARYTGRIVELRDGQIIRDEPVDDTLHAGEELTVAGVGG